MDATTTGDPQKGPTRSKQPGEGWKAKYQALREKYERVNADHEEYERQLDLGKQRVKKLQDEIQLLLDAIHLTLPGEPLLWSLYQNSPTSTTTIPRSSHTPVQPQVEQHPPVPQINGHTYSHSNGRYREWESGQQPNDVTPHGNEPALNGHLS